MKKTLIMATTVAASLILMGPVPCQAQEVSAKQKQFEKLDADQSGTLTLEEYTSIVNTPGRAEHFKRLDYDQNGSLTLEEFSTPPARQGKE